MPILLLRNVCSFIGAYYSACTSSWGYSNLLYVRVSIGKHRGISLAGFIKIELIELGCMVCVYSHLSCGGAHWDPAAGGCI